MEPYSIVCTTCQARLRVRKASAIGQILACPKCQSMVLITPPPDGSASSTGSGSASEIAPVAARTPKPKSPRQSRFREDFPELDAADHVQRPGDADGVQAGEEAAEFDETPAASLSRAHVQQWGVLVIAGLSGVLLAILVLALLAGRGCGRRDATRVSHAEANATQTPLGPPAKRVVEQPKTKSEQDAKVPEKVPEKNDDSVAGGATGTDSQEPTTGTKGASSPPPAAPPEKVPNQAPDSPQAKGDAPNATANDTDTDTGTDMQSPPGLVPRAPAPAGDSSQPDVSSDQSPPDANSPKVPPADALGNTKPPVRVDVDAALNMVILSEEFERVTLVEFVRFIRDLTALPVTLQLDSILAEGLSADTELSVHVSGVTVKQMIEKTLKTVDLSLVVAQNQLVITTPVEVSGEQQLKTYAVGDLVTATVTAPAIAELIRSFIAPRSWQTSGGLGEIQITDESLVVKQTSVIHFEIMRFLDRLRVVRGLLPRGDLAKPFVDPRPMFVQAAESLSLPVTVAISRPTPVAEILRRIEAETDLRILVDWRRVTQSGVFPRSDSTLLANGEPLREVLNKWLGPANLAFRVVTPNTVQISTQADIDARLEVEIYRLKTVPKQGAEMAKLLDDAKKYVGSSYFKSAGGQGELRLDATDGVLIAALPDPRHRALAKWLADRE